MAIPAHYARDCRVSCACVCACTPVRAWACVTRVSKFARDFSGGGFWVFVSPVFGRFFAPVLGGFFGLLFGCGWVCVWVVFWGLFWGGGVGGCSGRTRTATATAKRRTGARAHGNRKRRKRERAHGLPVFVRPSNLIFLALIIFTVWGGILQRNGNRKTANSMCPLTLTPTPIFPNTEHIRSVGGFGNLPNGGGEFRNRNHGFLLRSIQTIDKFSRTVGNFIEDLLILSNRAYFTWFRTALILVPAATIVTEVFLYNI